MTAADFVAQHPNAEWIDGVELLAYAHASTGISSDTRWHFWTNQPRQIGGQWVTGWWEQEYSISVIYSSQGNWTRGDGTANPMEHIKSLYTDPIRGTPGLAGMKCWRLANPMLMPSSPT